MNRIVANRLFLLLALAHFLTDAGFAGAAILCIGSDDHRAVESQHAGDRGCPSKSSGPSSTREVAGLSLADPLANDCVDQPLHSDAELVSSQPQSADSPPAVGVALAPVRASIEPIPNFRPRARAPDETAAYRAIRSTVLIV